MKNMTVTSCPAGNVPKGVTSHIEKEEFRIRMPKKHAPIARIVTNVRRPF